MSSSQSIGGMAEGIWNDLGGPSDVDPLVISGWACSDYALGKLNALTSQCYTGIVGSGTPFPVINESGLYRNYDVGPDLDNGSLAILESMWRITYLKKLVRAVAGAGGATPWISIQEGDQKIARVNPSTLAKVYSDQLKDAEAQQNYLVNAYNSNSQGAGLPRSVDFLYVKQAGRIE